MNGRRSRRHPAPPQMAAPWICLFLPVAFAALFHEFLVLPRGVRISVPQGASGPAAAPGERMAVVAVDARGQFFFENQLISPDSLAPALAARARAPQGPRTLLVHADAGVRADLLSWLSGVAAQAGMGDTILLTRP